MIEISPEVKIPEGELEFTASRSGGPGGQHVNKVSSRVELRFDVGASKSLTPEQKHRIVTRLSNRITKDGFLRVVASTSRSQHANREEAVTRFARLIANALERRRRRVKTAVPGAAKKRRLEAKKARGGLKQTRSGVDRGEMD
jgi:ribosome-associated protein